MGTECTQFRKNRKTFCSAVQGLTLCIWLLKYDWVQWLMLFANTTYPHSMKEMCPANWWIWCYRPVKMFCTFNFYLDIYFLVFLRLCVSFGIVEIHWCWWFCYLVILSRRRCFYSSFINIASSAISSLLGRSYILFTCFPLDGSGLFLWDGHRSPPSRLRRVFL